MAARLLPLLGGPASPLPPEAFPPRPPLSVPFLPVGFLPLGFLISLIFLHLEPAAGRLYVRT